MPIKFKDIKKNAKSNQPETKAKPTEEAVELMKAIHARKTEDGTPVTRPGDVFKVLTEQLGFQRSKAQDQAAQAREFVGAVRRHLVSQKKRSPTYDEVLSVMRKLGYQRD